MSRGAVPARRLLDEQTLGLATEHAAPMVEKVAQEVRDAPVDVDVDELVLDPCIQPREAIQPEIVAEYTEDMRRGAKFPALVVFVDPVDGTKRVAAGFHRGLAGKAQTRPWTLPCILKAGGVRDAVLWAAGTNGNDEHGVRRTRVDIERVITRFLDDPEWSQWSDGRIAEHCKVVQSTVTRHRARLLEKRAGATHAKHELETADLAELAEPSELAEVQRDEAPPPRRVGRDGRKRRVPPPAPPRPKKGPTRKEPGLPPLALDLRVDYFRAAIKQHLSDAKADRPVLEGVLRELAAGLPASTGEASNDGDDVDAMIKRLRAKMARCSEAEWPRLKEALREALGPDPELVRLGAVPTTKGLYRGPYEKGVVARLRARREAAGLSQAALSEAAGLARGRVQRLEGGDCPGLWDIFCLAAALKVPLWELLQPAAKPERGRS